MAENILSQEVQKFIESLDEMKWLDNHGEIPPDALMFGTREAAVKAVREVIREVGLAATYAVARVAGVDVMLDAELYADYLMVSDLLIAPNHLDHIKKLWPVWQAGYGVCCDVDGVLYCYRRS